jgi:anti-sigma factor RsiW
MLTCKDVTERVTAYVERELTWPERVQYWLHLAVCEVCRRYVTQMRTTTSLVRRLGDDVPLAPAPPLDPALRAALRAVRDQSPTL